MRLFRQYETGNWDEVMERVAEALKKEFSLKSTPKKQLATPVLTEKSFTMGQSRPEWSESVENQPVADLKQKINKGFAVHAEKVSRSNALINKKQLPEAEEIWKSWLILERRITLSIAI